MTKEIIATKRLDMDALTLLHFLKSQADNSPDLDLSVVYIRDEHGRIFDQVSLVCETLTDGSQVHDLVLSGGQS